MIWLELLKRIDDVRSVVRSSEEFKHPRSIVPTEHAAVDMLDSIKADILKQEGPKTVTLELDDEGNPIVPHDLKHIFTAQQRNTNEGAKVVRASQPIRGGDRPQPAAAAEATKGGKQATLVLPRDTPRVEHPISLEDATESTVAK